MQKSMIKLVSIADVITIVNAIFGFLAILILFSDIIPSDELRIQVSFSFILLALLADGLDGIIARKTRKGDLGEYLEAMADMTSLGLAPAFFVYAVYHNAVSYCIYYHSYLVIALILFISLGIIRLASFHIMKEKNFFVGLPASASTIFILILAFLEVGFLYILVVIVVVSFAMVSNVRFPKLGFKIDAIAAALIVLTLVMGKSYYGIASVLLLVAVAAYVVAGPFYLLKRVNNV